MFFFFGGGGGQGAGGGWGEGLDKYQTKIFCTSKVEKKICVHNEPNNRKVWNNPEQ